jgi:chitinase
VALALRMQHLWSSMPSRALLLIAVLGTGCLAGTAEPFPPPTVSNQPSASPPVAGPAAPTAASPPEPAQPGQPAEPPAGSALPARVTGVYWPRWPPASMRVRDIPTGYNLIYLFAATPIRGVAELDGAVEFLTPGNDRGAATFLKEDVALVRAQGRRVILSVGGAGNGMSFNARAQSQRLVNSVAALNAQFGPFDGLDWNTYEAGVTPNAPEYIWMSLELKRRFPGFLITTPPAPWNRVDRDFCVAMKNAGAVDFIAPQFYDGPNLAVQSEIVRFMGEWAAALGGWDKLGVGFGVNAGVANYMEISQAIATWNQLEAAQPTLRGMMNWEINTDARQGYPVATQLVPLVASP